MTSNKFKSLLTLMLVAVMAFSVVAPTIAAPVSPTSLTDTNTPTAPYQVNIVPNENTTTPTGNLKDDTALKQRFAAYQIFSGMIGEGYQGGTVTPPRSNGYEDPNTNQLGAISWGMSINKANIVALLEALKSSNVKASDLGITADDLDDARYNGLSINSTLGAIFGASLEYAGYDADKLEELKTATPISDEDLTGTATAIATVLNDLAGENGNADLAEAFARIVAAKSGNAYAYLSTSEAVSRWCDGVNTGDDTVDHGGRWEIGHSNTAPAADGYNKATDTTLNGGYYLIIDTYSNANGDPIEKDTMSDFIVGVMGDTTLTMKSAGVTSDKKIVRSDGEKVNADDYEIGEEITFLLNGTLPKNYDNYSEYFYAFHDTMTKGLTFKKTATPVAASDIEITVTVKVENPLFVPEAERDGSEENYKLNEYFYVPVTLSGGTVISKANYDALAANGVNDGTITNGLDPHTYYIVLTENADGTTGLDVYFPDLKQFDTPKVNARELTDAQVTALTEAYGEDFVTDFLNWGGSFTLASGLFILPSAFFAGSTFEVRYKASLNENAKTTGPEINTFDLEYSRNPNGSEHGKTTENKVYVYNFGLDIYKYDGVTGKPLGGAGFVVSSNVRTPVVEYKILNADTWGSFAEARDFGVYVTGPSSFLWVREDDLAEYFEVDVPKLRDWIKDGYLDHLSGSLTADSANFISEYMSDFFGLHALKQLINPGSTSSPSDFIFGNTADSLYLLSEADISHNTNFDEILESRVTQSSTTYPGYAFFAKDEHDEYAVAGWLTKEMVASLANVDSFDKMTEEKWQSIATVTGNKLAEVSALFNEEYADKNAEANIYHIVLMTEDDGKLHTRGLENESYTLTEVIVPDGYDKPTGSYSVEFEATYYEDESDSDIPTGDPHAVGGLLKNLTATITKPDGTTKEIEIVKDGKWVKFGDGENDYYGDLVASVDVPNIPNAFLPGTGGIGTTIFYTVGALLVLCSAWFTVMNKRKQRAI